MVLSEYSFEDDRHAFKSAPRRWVRGASRSCSWSNIENWCWVNLKENGEAVVDCMVWCGRRYGAGMRIMCDSEMGDWRLKF